VALVLLIRMNHAEVPPNSAVPPPTVGLLELLVFLDCQVRQRAFEVGNDLSYFEGSSGKDTELRFSSAVRVAGGVANFDGPRRKVKLKVAGCVTEDGYN